MSDRWEVMNGGGWVRMQGAPYFHYFHGGRFSWCGKFALIDRVRGYRDVPDAMKCPTCAQRVATANGGRWERVR